MNDHGGHYLLWHETLLLLGVWILPGLVPALVAGVVLLRRSSLASNARIVMFTITASLISSIAVIALAIAGPRWLRSLNKFLSVGNDSVAFAPAFYLVVALTVAAVALLFARRVTR